MLVVLKTKVRLIPEDELEFIQENSEAGLTPKGAKWVVREVARNSDDIRQIIRYNSKKTLLETYDGETLMVYESFEDVFTKWKEAIPTDLNLEDVPEELE